MDSLELPAALWIRGIALTPCLIGGASLGRRRSLVAPTEIIGVTSIVAGVALERLHVFVPISALIVLLLVASLPTALAHRAFVDHTTSTEQRP